MGAHSKGRTRNKLWVLVIVLSWSAFAQDPVKTLPDNYQVVLENQWVRVIRVHYAPHEKVPVHDHAAGPVIYVYLADSGEVRFQHIGPGNVLATRPAEKQGGFRMHHALVERHSVENISDTPSDFLRVELKALPSGRQIPDGKFEPPDLSAGVGFERVEFEDDDVRIVRSVCGQHEACAARDVLAPALEVTFRAATLVRHAISVECVKLQAGELSWIGSAGVEEVWNPGAQMAHQLRIEFKAAGGARSAATPGRLTYLGWKPGSSTAP